MAKLQQSSLEDDIVKEVHNTHDIKAKTELTPPQIERINKLGTLAKVMASGLLELHVNDFLVLQKSKNRQSMGEFVNSITSKRQDLMNKGKTFFNNMLG